MSDPYCSQLFFPIQGNLAYYSTRSRKISRLFTGMNRSETVETDPSWSPDGNYILFSRTILTRDLFRELGGKTIFSAENSSIEKLNEEYPVQFDVYRVPFNSGDGGHAEPLTGASGNGKSNYFARYSPDGKWIVFTQSKTGLVLQPDSKLYIMSTGGGTPRALRCNRSRVNSWHTWSPNSRWLAFVSKNDTPYTELFLTHIDANGRDSVPIMLSRLSKSGYAINVPEFADIDPQGIRKITVQSK
jgi:Tol biopolymer transport system component